jgi:polyphenol oxidase
LKAAGLTHVHDLALCTYADEARFYSFRRATHRNEIDYGRLISAIALV